MAIKQPGNTATVVVDAKMEVLDDVDVARLVELVVVEVVLVLVPVSEVEVLLFVTVTEVEDV